MILVDRTSATPNAKFNFAWFLPALQLPLHPAARTGLILRGAAVTLANPLLIQVIIDKVIAQRNLDAWCWESHWWP